MSTALAVNSLCVDTAGKAVATTISTFDVHGVSRRLRGQCRITCPLGIEAKFEEGVAVGVGIGTSHVGRPVANRLGDGSPDAPLGTGDTWRIHIKAVGSIRSDRNAGASRATYCAEVLSQYSMLGTARVARSRTSVAASMSSSPGRIVWQKETTDPALLTASTVPVPSTHQGWPLNPSCRTPLSSQ